MANFEQNHQHQEQQKLELEEGNLHVRNSDFQINLIKNLKLLRTDPVYIDVTLVCEDGQQLEAHKTVLAISSPYFKLLFEKRGEEHPTIKLKNVSFSHLQSIMEFIYSGEVKVAQDEIQGFLKTAQMLEIKGLRTGDDDKNK